MKHNFKQEHVADELGLTQSYYSRIERGEVDIHVSLLLRMAHLYGISVVELVERDLS
jgi:transcriptional regulator with XRE-family HTH domain